jgi:hypothetical protein
VSRAVSTPLNFTLLTPFKLLPLIVTTVPTAPDNGEKFVIVGRETIVKASSLIAVPFAVLTLMKPVAAVDGTVALISVSELTVNKAVAALNFTNVAAVKFVPMIVTLVPTAPVVGENEPITGRAVGLLTMKLVTLVAVPAVVVMVIVPVLALFGTVVIIWVSVLLNIGAGVPLKATAIAPFKPVPVIVTLVSIWPLVGEKLVIVGGGGGVIADIVLSKALAI